MAPWAQSERAEPCPVGHGSEAEASASASRSGASCWARTRHLASPVAQARVAREEASAGAASEETASSRAGGADRPPHAPDFCAPRGGAVAAGRSDS